MYVYVCVEEADTDKKWNSKCRASAPKLLPRKRNATVLVHSDLCNYIKK